MGNEAQWKDSSEQPVKIYSPGHHVVNWDLGGRL
jgi:hypothetical protein